MWSSRRRRGHQHLDAFFQLDGLGLHVHAAKHHGAAQLGVLGVQGNLLCHLIGQFTRGQQHQGAHRMAGRRCRSVFMAHQALQQGRRKPPSCQCLVWAAPMTSLPVNTTGMACA
jgi:hypothetical protein